MGKKIYIAYTGGTIGMGPGDDGYQPVPGLLSTQMQEMNALSHPRMPAYDIHEYAPLIDSANMSPRQWLHIARDIAANYDAYDGFVVLHGTDTMAYTASALPFMLEGLAKPVIVTGAQVPMCEVRNDARENLITALWIAAHFPVPEVCLLFGNRLLRGNRSTKTATDAFDAFDSPNFPALGRVGADIDIRWDLVLPVPEPAQPIAVTALSESRVAALRLFPGMSPDVLANILAPPIKGLVLETYGTGNAPTDDPRLLTVLSEAAARGVVTVNCTQCLKGRVRMETYATGIALSRAGVISGQDMTPEAALTKLFYLFSQNLPTEDVRRQMQMNLQGELTPEHA